MKRVLLLVAAIIVLTIAITVVMLIVLPNSDGKAAAPEPTEEPGSFSYVIDPAFVTNIKDSSRYAKTAIVLVVNNEGDIQLLGEQDYIIKNVIIEILRNTTEEEFLKSEIQTVLGEKIIEGLNKAIPIQGLEEVYFTQLVIQ